MSQRALASRPPGRARSDVARSQRLPPPQRAFFEHAFSQDFSQVRVHTDGGAQALAAALGAKAVTHGEDIAFAAGRYEPESSAGRRLLAHELAHVAQQRQGGGGSASGAEQRARSAGQTVAQGGTVSPDAVGAAEPGLQCDPEDERRVLPPLPNLQLSTLPPLDFLTLQGIAAAHGQRLTLRDTSDLAAQWYRSASMLRLFGLDRGIHLGPISFTGDELINLGLGIQFQDRLARENPNAWDRFELQWKQAHPDAFTIPPITLKTWQF